MKTNTNRQDVDDQDVDDNDADDCDCNGNVLRFDVGVLDLLDFGGPNLMRNGEEVYRSSHLLELGVVSYGVETCKLEGTCMQSSHRSEPPHQLTIDTAQDFKKWKFYCTCKSGSGGKCKHLYAALLHIHTEKDLEIITCTQRKQNWGKVSKEVAESILAPELISNLNEMKSYKRYEYTVTEEERECFAEILFSDPKSAVAIFLDRHKKAEESKTAKAATVATTELSTGTSIAGTSDGCCNVVEDDTTGLLEFLTRVMKNVDFPLRNCTITDRTLENFYNKRVCLSLDEAIELNVKTRNQGCDVWHFERKFRITASDCYKLFTAYKNPKTQWSSKIVAYYRPKPDLKNFQIGRREETNAIELYEKFTQKKVTKVGLVVHSACPWLGSSPDGYVIESKTVIEIKTLMNEKDLPFNEALASVSYLKFSEGRYTLREKHSHNAQIQLNMHLLCAPKASLIVHNYKSKEIEIIHVDYDHTFCLNLIVSLKSIYFEYALPYIFQNFTRRCGKSFESNNISTI